MLWLRMSPVVCGCVFYFVVGLFFSKPNWFWTPFVLPTSQTSHICVILKDCMKQNWWRENSNLSICEIVMTLQQSLFFCILAWRILLTEEPWWAAVHVIAESDTTERLTLFFPPFCKCLEVPLSHSRQFYGSNLWKRGCLLRVCFKETWERK